MALRLLLGLCLAAASAAPAGPKARVYKRAAQPGEAVLVVVTGNDPSRPPLGMFAGNALLFHRAEPKTYVALAGIDLEASTGTVAVTLTMYAPGGASRAWSEAMTIRPKAFAERRLTVAEQYVEPPPEQEARAEQETQRVKAVFAEASPAPAIAGAFRMPIQGAKTTSRFGERSFFNGKARAPHSGADIKASTGTPVLAPQSGTVVMAEELYYPGRTMLLDHGLGVYSLFAHLSESVKPVGSRVKAGELIGRAGATGRVTGPHLHWAVRVGGARVDPMSVVWLPLGRWLSPLQKRTRR